MFSRNAKPGLGMGPKENFLAFLTKFTFLKIKIVPGNAVMVAVGMCKKRPITREWIYGIT